MTKETDMADTEVIDGTSTLVVHQPAAQAPARREDLTAYLPENASIVERAVFAGMPLDVIDRLRIMAKEERAEVARLAFLAAKVAAKKAIPRVLKARENTHTKSKYADLAAIDRALTPVITEHGFTLDFTAAPSERAGFIDVTCTTIHDEGHTESFTLPWPLDGEGMKGNSNKTPVQAMKSTITFARRTMKMMAFDIADADDDDGNQGQPPATFVSEDQIAELDALMKASGTVEKNFLGYVGVDQMTDIPALRFPALKKMLETKIAKAKKTETEQ